MDNGPPTNYLGVGQNKKINGKSVYRNLVHSNLADRPILRWLQTRKFYSWARSMFFFKIYLFFLVSSHQNLAFLIPQDYQWSFLNNITLKENLNCVVTLYQDHTGFYVRKGIKSRVKFPTRFVNFFF